MSSETKYHFCRVCNKPVGTLTAHRASQKHKQLTCSLECRQKETHKRYACCDKATQVECVCLYATTCPVHGERHNGTHD